MSDNKFIVFIYLPTMLILSTIVAAIAYLVYGWFGVDGDIRLFAATQTPIFLILVLWFVILIRK